MRSGFGRSYNSPSAPRIFVALAGIALMCTALTLGVLVILQPSNDVQKVTSAIHVERSDDVRFVKVLVAINDIPEHTALRPDMFRVEERPLISLSHPSIASSEELVGQYAKATILRGRALERDYVMSTKPLENEIVDEIGQRQRAVTISVDSIKSVEGWARRGARVDVLWITKYRGRPAAVVIAKQVLVMSAERSLETQVSARTPVPSTATLLVSEEDAPRILLAQTQGSLVLALRGNDDHTGTRKDVFFLDELLNDGSDDVPLNTTTSWSIKIGDESFDLKNGRLVPVPSAE